MIELDGAIGGGQVVRTALALSALTGKSFRIKNIRAGRSKPGLKAQHLTGVKALQELCSASVEGLELGSTELLFMPRELKPKGLKLDIGTAGSTTLLLQCLLIPLIRAEKPCTISITGGTNASWAMPVEYVQQVLLPWANLFGPCQVKVRKRGYFPKGGGVIDVKFATGVHDLPTLTIVSRPKLRFIRGVVHASKGCEEKAKKCAARLKSDLAGQSVPVRIDVELADTSSEGYGASLWSLHQTVDNVTPMPYVGSDRIASPKDDPEKLASDIVAEWSSWSKNLGAVDSHLADNLIPFLAVAAAGSLTTTRVSNHCKANAYVCEKFLPVSFEFTEMMVLCKPC
jgi:RNA 3'-terminal phosphate cyclase (ATP)